MYLFKRGIKITLIDARFAKPLDTKLVDKILDNHEFIITIEEGSIGGFGSIFLHYIHNVRNKKTKSKVKNIVFPDIFVDHDTSENQYKYIGMDSKSIEEKIFNFIKEKKINLNQSLASF